MCVRSFFFALQWRGDGHVAVIAAFHLWQFLSQPCSQWGRVVCVLMSISLSWWAVRVLLSETRGFVFVFHPWMRSALWLLGGLTAAWGVTLRTFNNLEVTLSLHVGFSLLFLFWNGSVAETLTTLLQLSRKGERSEDNCRCFNWLCFASLKCLQTHRWMLVLSPC